MRLVGAKEEDAAAAKDPAANPVLSLDAYFLGSASYLLLFARWREPAACHRFSLRTHGEATAQKKQQQNGIGREASVAVTCSKLLRLHWTYTMASLYQRFTGKINTTNSFPHPPEASHLLGGQVADEENAAKNLRQVVDGKPHVQFRKKCQQEDEDVRLFYFSSRSVQSLHVYFDIASTERHSRRPMKYRSLFYFIF